MARGGQEGGSSVVCDLSCRRRCHLVTSQWFDFVWLYEKEDSSRSSSSSNSSNVYKSHSTLLIGARCTATLPVAAHSPGPWVTLNPEGLSVCKGAVSA